MVEYLEISHILAMQEVLIAKYGGIHGIRDRGLLESAISQPQQSAFGEDIFQDVPSKAAAYAFYLSENQPFLDGNKRIATAAALTFLRLNGFEILISDQELYETMMKLAYKKLSRDGLTDWLRQNTRKKSMAKKSKAPRKPSRRRRRQRD